MLDAADRLKQYVRRLDPPTQEALAKALGVRQSQVSTWLCKTKRPGLKFVFAIEKLTGIKPETWAKVELVRGKPREGKAA